MHFPQQMVTFTVKCLIIVSFKLIINMATFKTVIVSQNQRSDGTYNVKIRVTHDRKVKYISTPFYVLSSEVTKKMNIKISRLLTPLMT